MEHSLEHTCRGMSQRGIHVISCSMCGKDNVCLSLERGRLVGIDETKLTTEAEKNTALIHEDGHFMSKAFYVPFSVYQVKAQAEYRADKAAIQKHIPYSELSKLLRRNTPSWEIADYFCVTPAYLQKAYDLYKDLGYPF